MLNDDVKNDEMVFIGNKNKGTWKNQPNGGVTGYYDLVKGKTMSSSVCLTERLRVSEYYHFLT